MTAYLLLAGHRSAQLEQEIAAGRHPRVEYLELLERYDIEVVDFGAGAEWAGSRRMVPASLSPYWSLAMLSARSHRAGDQVLAMGEDIGIRTALLHLFRLRRRRPRIYVVTHGSYLRSRKLRVLARLVRWSRTDVDFLCLSEAIAGGTRAAGFPPRSVRTTGYGIDTSFFQPTERMPDGDGQTDECALVVSAGTANRDFATLIEAVRGSQYTLHIAADSAWHSERVDVDRSQLPANVTIEPAAGYTDLRELYSRAVAVVVPLHPAKRASGYAVIGEAMAMAKPVISTRYDGQSDYIVDGETGILVVPGSAAAIVNALDTVTSGDGGRLGEHARQSIVAQHSIDDYVSVLAAAVGLAPTTSATLGERTPGAP